jgi:hypothetical protein
MFGLLARPLAWPKSSQYGVNNFCIRKLYSKKNQKASKNFRGGLSDRPPLLLLFSSFLYWRIVHLSHDLAEKPNHDAPFFTATHFLLRFHIHTKPSINLERTQSF